MWFIIRFATHKMLGLKRPGLVTGIWLIWYAIARSFCEIFREPEAYNIFNIGPFTAGQVYCLPMLLIGVYLVWLARRPEASGKVSA
jgi:phosphatidylglycerol:prolipoprotein diacylglycerol transferase